MSHPHRSAGLLYVGGFDFPAPQARAIQSLHTAHALARAGWCVRLLTQRSRLGAAELETTLAAYGLAPHPELQIVPLPVVRPGRLPGLGIHARLALTNWSYGAACLFDLLRGGFRPDALLVRDPRLAWIFLRARHFHRLPVVYEVHELFSTRPRDNRSLEPERLRGVAARTRRLERSVLAQADLLLPLTRCCADLLGQEFGVPPSRMAVVPDGTAPPSGPLPARDPASREVVYAGQLYPWKGVDTLLLALAKLDNVHLTVFGGLGPANGPDPDLQACRALARRVGVEARVDFAGFIPPAEVRPRLAGAAAAVLPLPELLMSRYFTSPLKLFDYMAAGVPIVASDLPALREVLVDGENALLVPPGGPRALAHAISRLLADPLLADRLRGRAFQDVRAYTWDRRAERIIEAVEPLIPSRQQSAVSRQAPIGPHADC